jgi:hypothetical protein
MKLVRPVQSIVLEKFHPEILARPGSSVEQRHFEGRNRSVKEELSVIMQIIEAYPSNVNY